VCIVIVHDFKRFNMFIWLNCRLISFVCLFKNLIPVVGPSIYITV